jgi:putative endonuclease
MTNRANGTLYTGVTSNISRRAWEHREGLVEGFTRRYGLKRLVYLERYERITDAIQRESNMKQWARAWKVRLILEANPGWADLYEMLNA